MYTKHSRIISYCTIVSSVYVMSIQLNYSIASYISIDFKYSTIADNSKFFMIQYDTLWFQMFRKHNHRHIVPNPLGSAWIHQPKNHFYLDIFSMFPSNATVAMAFCLLHSLLNQAIPAACSLLLGTAPTTSLASPKPASRSLLPKARTPPLQCRKKWHLQVPVKSLAYHSNCFTDCKTVEPPKNFDVDFTNISEQHLTYIYNTQASKVSTNKTKTQPALIHQ